MNLPTGTVTLMFTDVEGSTRLLAALGDRYADLLDDHRQLVRASVAAEGGVEVDTQGDAFLVAFAAADAALAAAVEIQRAHARHDWPSGAVLRVRIGLHTGTPLVRTDGYVGLDVHRGARIGAAGHGGQIVVSAAVYAACGAAVPGGAVLRSLGSHRLKDLDEPLALFDVEVDGLPTRFPPLRTSASASTDWSAVREPRQVLLVQDGGGGQRVVSLDTSTSPFTIGRRSTNDLSLGWDLQVSRVHARLERTGDGWDLIDEGTSRNGTYLDGEKIVGRRPLHDDAVIRLGDTLLCYRCSGSKPARTYRSSAATVEAALPRASDIGPDDLGLLAALAGVLDVPGSTPTVEVIAERVGRPAAEVARALDELRRLFDVSDLPAAVRDVVLIERAQALNLASGPAR